MPEFLLDGTIQRDFLAGLLVTLKISVVSSVCALVLGFLTAFCRISPMWLLRALATSYVELFRNTPLLIQLYLYYRGLSALGIVLQPELCGILALSLYTGAYMSEVFRAGLLAIPRQQLDAGLSLGLSRFQVYWTVLIPQAVRMILPALGNQLISLTKNSSLVAFVTVSDLFFVVYKGAVDAFQPTEYFLEGAVLYLMLSLSISGLLHLVELLLSKPSPLRRLHKEPAYG